MPSISTAPPLPGDESITLRALIAGALSDAPLAIRNVNTGESARRIAEGLRALGATVSFDGSTAAVAGGSLRDTAMPIDCGSSLDAAELLLGLCAGAGLRATLLGDIATTLEPLSAQLRAFGAQIETHDGSFPATVRGTGDVQTRTFLLVAPSRATQAALRFAARFAGVAITIGGDKGLDDGAERLLVYLDDTGARKVTVPADFGAAAHLLVDAVLTPGASVRLEGVSVNPLRAGLLDVLSAMGAPIVRENERELCGQPVADLTARYVPLAGTTIAGDLLARSRPELDLVARLAAGAAGHTRILGRDLPDPAVPFERLPNGLAFTGLRADTQEVSETTA